MRVRSKFTRTRRRRSDRTPPAPDPRRRAGASAAVGIGLFTIVATVMVASPASARPIGAGPLSASNRSSTEVVDGCTVVLSPTRSHFTSCPGQNLGTANFTGFDLRFADFAGANFAPPSCEGVFERTTVCPGANFTFADLDHADVANAVFSFCCGTAFEPILGTATLTGASLEHIDAAGAVFADLSGLDLRHADLTRAEVEFFGGFKGSDLTGANLSQTGLSENTLGFVDAVLRGTDFSGTDVGGLSFEGAALSVRTNFEGSEIEASSFTGTRLVPANRTVPASSPSGAVVKWRTPAGVPGATPGACTPASGSPFPVGVTTVTCAVNGGPGFPNIAGPNTASGTFTVTVQ